MQGTLSVARHQSLADQEYPTSYSSLLFNHCLINQGWVIPITLICRKREIPLSQAGLYLVIAEQGSALLQKRE